MEREGERAKERAVGRKNDGKKREKWRKRASDGERVLVREERDGV